MTIGVQEIVSAARRSRLLGADVVPDRDMRGQPLGDAVQKIALQARIPAEALYRAVAEARGMEYVDCETATPSLDDARRLPEVLLRRGAVLPCLDEGRTVLAVSDPDDRAACATARQILGPEIPVCLADPTALRAAGRRALRMLGRDRPSASAVEVEDTVALLDRILLEAYLRRASDVHLEPGDDGMRVRLRIDGDLSGLLDNLDREEAAGLVSRVKVLAGLDIAEQRAPQDGGFHYRLPAGDKAEIELRAATIPTRTGERATLRLLGTAPELGDLDGVGMEPEDLSAFRTALRRPHGLVIVCGPTGSGKTTTLYAALREIARPEINVMTVEDPVESRLPGVAQVQVSHGGKLRFDTAIRSLLRHDPDILMVGEIRDFETADIAIKAAMTGHLVLTTLHANTAAGAITRLLDLGCEPYRIAATLSAVVSQRLVRRLCDRCKQADPVHEAPHEWPDWNGATTFGPGTCARCLGTGYRGRIGLFETLWIDARVARQITSGQSEADISRAGRDLVADARRKVETGTTSVAEVRRAIHLDS